MKTEKQSFFIISTCVVCLIFYVSSHHYKTWLRGVLFLLIFLVFVALPSLKSRKYTVELNSSIHDRAERDFSRFTKTVLDPKLNSTQLWEVVLNAYTISMKADQLILIGCKWRDAPNSAKNKFSHHHHVLQWTWLLLW